MCSADLDARGVQDKSIKIWDLRMQDCVVSMETASRGCYGLAVHEVKLLQAVR